MAWSMAARSGYPPIPEPPTDSLLLVSAASWALTSYTQEVKWSDPDNKLAALISSYQPEMAIIFGNNANLRVSEPFDI